VTAGAPDAVPVWLQLAYGIGVPAIAIVYWREYGPQNFLWLSDIALVLTAATVLTADPLPASMAAVGVLPLELAWLVDFVTGGRVIGLANYMFDPSYPLYTASLFHIVLPPTWLFLLSRLGYDRRALVLQSALTVAVLAATYLGTDPDKNINWVFGLGARPQQSLQPLLYLALEIIAILVAVIMPLHFLLRFVFRPA
jgi:hypothetical protein